MIVRHVLVQKEVLVTWYQLCRKVQKTQYVQSVPKEGEVKEIGELELNMSITPNYLFGTQLSKQLL